MISSFNSANFNNNELTQVLGVTILGSDNYNPAKRSLVMYDRARTSRADVTSSDYNDKAIGVRVGISQNTRALVEQSLDALLALIQEPEADLLVKQSGGLRRYVCTYEDYTIQSGGTAYMEITLIFKTSDHFGYDTYPTVLLNVTGQTALTRSDQVRVGGSARFQVPIITLTITSLSSDGSNKTLQFGNGNTGQVTSITRNWKVNDVVKINPLTQSVQVNGSEVAFSGAIPEWKTGYGYFTFFSQISTLQYNVNLTQYRRWV